MFHGWEMNPEDPFYLPVTFEQIEEFGENEVAPNSAKRIIQYVRELKGMSIEKKVVEAGDKQRTMSKKK